MSQTLIIEPQPSKKLGSETVVYYVRDKASKKLLCKFDTNTTSTATIDQSAQLTPEQKFELENYLANIRFTIDKLNFPARYNRIYRIMLPEPLQTTLTAFAQAAQKHNIHFDPMTAMLNGFFNHLSTTDQRLIAQGESSLLEKLGIQATKYQHTKVEIAQSNRKYTKKLFNQLLKITNGFYLYADIAKTLYHKETNINQTTVTSYADGKTKPSAWSVSCVISALAKSKDPLLITLPSNILIDLWLKPLRFGNQITSIEQAVQLFKQYFQFESELAQQATQAIIYEMKKPL